MKKTKIIIMLLIMVMLSIMVAPVVKAANTVEVSILGYRNYDFAIEVFNLTNAQRKANGKSVLALDKTLTEAAMKRAEEIAIYFSHTRPDESSWKTSSEKSNGENLGIVYETPEEIMDGWMNSQSHKANIIKDNYNSIGIGCYCQDDIYYWSQVFSRTPETEAMTQTGVTEEYETQVEVAVTKLGNLRLEFSKRNLSIYPGETIDVKQVYLENYEYYGQDYYYIPIEKDNVVFTSSNKNVMVVDQNTGKITARNSGTAEITATLGNSTITYTVTVLKSEVNEKLEQYIEDENILGNLTIDRELILKCDVNGDGFVNSFDASTILDKFKNGNMTPEEFKRCDINEDGFVNSIDASIVLDVFKMVK